MNTNNLMSCLNYFNPFFIQIGAMDGKSFDMLNFYVQKYKWRGLFVEPIIEEFEKLKANYRWHDGVLFENSAIKKSKNRKMFKVEIDKPETARGLSTFYPNKNNVHKYPAKNVKSVFVNCISLKELFKKHNLVKCDLLVLDTEGCDAEILADWNFDIKPKVIIYETQNITKEEKQNIDYILLNLKYNSKQLKFDKIAWKFPPVF